MKKILRRAIVLLISVVLFFSSVAIAETVKKGIPLEPNIDAEKYIWDEKNQEWVDADNELEALDIPICNDLTFKIIIYNNGDEHLFNLHITDSMLDGLEFISADPEPDDFQHDPPYYSMFWLFPGPLNPNETIEIIITAQVVGPECSIDYNYIEVLGFSEDGTSVTDSDYCFVHAIKQSREFSKPALVLLDCYPFLFPLLQKLIQNLRI